MFTIKRRVNKKNAYTFLVKNPPLYIGLGSKQKAFQQLPSKLSETTLFAV